MAAAKKPKRMSAKEKEALRKAKMQMNALIMMAVGAILLGLVLVKGDGIWFIAHNFLFGMFGFTAYLVPVGLIYLAVLTAMDKPAMTLGAKIWQTILLIFLISSAAQIFGWGLPMEVSLWGKIKELYNGGIALKGGGLASSVIGVPFLMLFGKTGAKITIVVLIVFILMILTGTTIKGIIILASKPVKTLEENYAKKIMENETTKQNKKTPKPPVPVPSVDIQPVFGINDPLDHENFIEGNTSVTEPAYSVNNINSIEEDIIIKTPSGKSKKKHEEPIIDENMPMHPVISPKERKEGNSNLMAAKENLLNKFKPASTAKITPENISSLPEDTKPPVVSELKEPEIIKENQTEPSVSTENLTEENLTEQEISVSEPVSEDTFTETSEPEYQDTDKKEDYIDDIVNKAVLNEVENPFSESQDIFGDETSEESVEEEKTMEQIYNFPPLNLLAEQENEEDENITEELKANAQKLVDTLQSFGVQTRVTEICRGPAVTRYELQPSAGVKISKITSLSDDIALNLATAGVRIEAPIPNKAAVGIEVPNKTISAVGIKEIIDSSEFSEAKSRLTVAMGKDIAGNITVADLAKMPHLLIAGATGSGKSVCINSIIISLLFKSSPDEVKLLMVDPKVVELGIYNGIPHLLVPVVTDPRKAAGALNWAVSEMLNRYKLFADSGVRDLKGYNRLCQKSDNENLKPMPQIVIIIDELADLMMAAPNEVEDAICRLAQMARAAGMHLVIATQRPSVDVITGVIKANIPSRIAFSVSSQVDSRTILDGSGAEKLLGRGDMLFYPVGMPKPTRVQGCFVSDEEVENVVEFIKNRDNNAEYDQDIIDEIDRQAVPEKNAKNSSHDGGGFDDADEMLSDAIECVVEMGQASTSMLQRKLKLGYARAARIIDQLEERGIVGEYEGSKPRQVLITHDQWVEMKMRENN